jgi:hypothetical protein
MLKPNNYSLDAKNLKVRIHSYRGFDIEIEFIPLSLASYESIIYDQVDGSVLLSFSYSGFALMLFCRCVLSLPPSVSRF